MFAPFGLMQLVNTLNIGDKTSSEYELDLGEQKQVMHSKLGVPRGIQLCVGYGSIILNFSEKNPTPAQMKCKWTYYLFESSLSLSQDCLQETRDLRALRLA